MLPPEPSDEEMGDFIRPARPISQSAIDEVLEWIDKIPRLGTHARIHLVLEIGFRLRCWHGLVGEKHWGVWRKKYLKRVPKHWVDRCMYYWDNNEQLTNALARLYPESGWHTPYYLSPEWEAKAGPINSAKDLENTKWHQEKPKPAPFPTLEMQNGRK